MSVLKLVYSCVHNTPDNLTSYPPDNHHSSDDAYWRAWGNEQLQFIECYCSSLHKAQTGPLLLQVPKLCQGLHFVNLVPSPPRQMPSAHWGEYGLNLNLNLLLLQWTETCCSSGVSRLLASEVSSAGRILERCRVNASPATHDRNDRARVFTGAAVNYNNNNNNNNNNYIYNNNNNKK